MDLDPGLELVEAFGDSIDIESGTDHLATTAGLATWLSEHGYPPAVPPTTADLEIVIALRTALRDELIAEHDSDAEGATRARDRLDAVAARIPLRATFGAGPAAVVAVGGGVAVPLGAILTAMVGARRDGSWRRLKICHEGTCRSVFYDRSKNNSKTWCSMEVCGNRNKTRSYRRRRAGTTGRA